MASSVFLTPGSSGGGGSSIPQLTYAANVLSLSNLANPQSFDIYKTLIDGANYGRLRLGWEVDNALIMPNRAGAVANPGLILDSILGVSLRHNGVGKCNTTSTIAWNCDGTLRASGLNSPPVIITASFTADTSRLVYLCDVTAGSITITLPPVDATVAGQIYYFKKIDASANTVTIDAAGATTIDGAATQVLSVQNSAIEIVMLGSSGNWYIVSNK